MSRTSQSRGKFLSGGVKVKLKLGPRGPPSVIEDTAKESEGAEDCHGGYPDDDG